MSDIIVPELAESISEASIDTWHVAVGDTVKTGQDLVSIETDKVMLDVPSKVNGVITAIVKESGADVSSLEVIGKIEEKEITASEESSPESKAKAKEENKAVAPKEEVKVGKSTSKAAPSSPSARRAAAEQDVDIKQVAGTGKGGRVSKADVQSSSTTVGVRSERREKMSKLRSKVAQRLLQSQQDAAILTTFNEVDMSAVINMRKLFRDKFEKKHGIKLGFMSFFVIAVTSAIKQYPIINAGIDGNEIVHHDYCDIGIAVGSPRGLVVPVLRNAEHMSMADIEANIADFGARAQTGALGIEELTGGTFTITNGGVFGSMLSTPIINPPQSAILGVHATKERAVVVDGQIAIRPMNYLALSYDHRLIDGRDAVLFLVAVKEALEYPGKVLLDI